VEDRYDIANVLLRHGAKVNVQDKHGHTALSVAIYNGFTGIVDVLLRKNADINIKNSVCYILFDFYVCNASIVTAVKVNDDQLQLGKQRQV